MTNQSRSGTYGRSPITMIDNEESRQNTVTEATQLLDASAERDDALEDDSDSVGNSGWEGYDDFKGLPWWRTPSVYWLILPYLAFTLAFGGIIVPKIELIVNLVCHHYFAEQQILDPSVALSPMVIGENDPKCNTAPVQKHVAAFTLVLSALAGGLSALVVPKLGSLSDRYGRKRLLVIASCGGIMNETITILAAKYPSVIDYRFLILGSFFDGLTGSFTAASVLSNSYVSDCTPPSKRGVALGYIQACIFTGLAFGPILAAKFTLWTGSILSIFYVALGCHVIVILFFWFALPESLSKKRQMARREQHQAEQEALQEALPASWERVFGSQPPAWLASRKLRTWLFLLFSANPLAPLKMFVPSGRENSQLRRNLIALGFIDSVLISAALGAGTVIILYARFMFNWETWDSSRFISIVSFFRVLVLVIVFPTINYFFRTRPLRHRQKLNGDSHINESHSGADNLDVWLLRLALVSDFVGVLGYVFVRTGELFVLSGACTAFGGLASATIQSSITKQVPAERVGSMLGAVGLLHAVSRVVAPIIFDGIYAGTVETFPQTFAVVLAALFGLSVLASLFVRPYVFLQGDGYATIPARDSADQEGPTNIIGEEVPSANLPRA